MLKSIINDIFIAQWQIRALIKMIRNAACRELSIIKSIFNGIGVMIAQCQVIIQWGSNRHHWSVSVWKIPTSISISFWSVTIQISYSVLMSRDCKSFICFMLSVVQFVLACPYFQVKLLIDCNHVAWSNRTSVINKSIRVINPTEVIRDVFSSSEHTSEEEIEVIFEVKVVICKKIFSFKTWRKKLIVLTVEFSGLAATAVVISVTMVMTSAQPAAAAREVELARLSTWGEGWDTRKLQDHQKILPWS